MSETEKQVNEEQQAIQQVFWKTKDFLIAQEGFDPADVMEAFYRAALVAYMAFKRGSNGDTAVEEIALYLANSKETKTGVH
jgi:hypothetical protein